MTCDRPGAENQSRRCALVTRVREHTANSDRRPNHLQYCGSHTYFSGRIPLLHEQVHFHPLSELPMVNLTYHRGGPVQVRSRRFVEIKSFVRPQWGLANDAAAG